MLPDIPSPAQTEQNVGLIFLVGFMGCGKTTLGRKLANRLGYQFIDLDHVFEAQEGTTIAEYFTQHGEEKFREIESALLKQTEYPANAIISTGGGLPCFFDNMDWMNSHGRTFYVKLSPKTLADRLDNGKTTRPVLQGKHGDELVALIEERLTEREPYYSQATFVVEGLNLNSEKAEQIIVNYLG
jgi:shikimate kinase